MRDAWQLVSVYDADSFHVNGTFTEEIDVGVRGYEGRTVGVVLRVQEMVRLVRVNAAELGTPLGQSARRSVAAWFADVALVNPESLQLVTAGRDKYKRLLGDVVARDGSRLSDFVRALPGSVPVKLTEQVRE